MDEGFNSLDEIDESLEWAKKRHDKAISIDEEEIASLLILTLESLRELYLKEVPTKPISIPNTGLYTCGKCGFFILSGKYSHYCYHCGQKLETI